jgi:hypothetical protein
MAMATDLMGLGESAFMANRVANGGSGPITLAAKGSSIATAAQIQGSQYFTFITGSGWVVLPVPGGVNGPLNADDFVIHNGTGGTITVIPPANSTINIGGQAFTQASVFSLTTLKTLTAYVVSSTQWFGLNA